ncbi:MAG: DNA-deoxyinosine glycosylase [Bacilli bacterium]|jgi:hypoxanthine-DNA glycosylase|nr:DNA-deoxyinosine glycosylase [Bacilli bacterium]
MDKNTSFEKVSHPFPPLIEKDSKVLILGSFPSVISREERFYYGNKQNRFWKVLFRLFNKPYQDEIEAKKKMILTHHLALFDVIGSCKIKGSDDSSINEIIPNDIPKLIEGTKISFIVLNGKKALSLYEKYFSKTLSLPYQGLPSTSPANAVKREEDLVKAYSVILKYLN